MSNKKKDQLGMNPSTASNRLVKDLLFNLLPNKKCYRCNKNMTRENFSIEHKIEWLDSKNPIKLYFDLNNITFSHLSCNIKSRRIKKGISHPSIESYNRGCRCDDCKNENKIHKRRMRLKHGK